MTSTTPAEVREAVERPLIVTGNGRLLKEPTLRYIAHLEAELARLTCAVGEAEKDADHALSSAPLNDNTARIYFRETLRDIRNRARAALNPSKEA